MGDGMPDCICCSASGVLSQGIRIFPIRAPGVNNGQINPHKFKALSRAYRRIIVEPAGLRHPLSLRSR
jgi:hypothetical protein